VLYGGDAAPLSIGRMVAVCAFPDSEAAQERVWNAFAALLESHGARVSLTTRGGLAVRRAAWRDMTAAARDATLGRVAHRLLARRLRAVELVVLRTWRPPGLTAGRINAAMAEQNAEGSRRAGIYVRAPPRGAEAIRTAARNVDQLVWRESRPVLHLAYAIRAELDRLRLTPWDWPLLAAELVGGRKAESVDARLRRMVRAAQVWQRAFAAAPVGAACPLPGPRPSEMLPLVLEEAVPIDGA